MNARIEGEIGAAAAGLNELRETGLVTDNLTPVSASRCAELCVFSPVFFILLQIHRSCSFSHPFHSYFCSLNTDSCQVNIGAHEELLTEAWFEVTLTG